MADPSGDDFYKPEGLVRRFATFNPHATFHFDDGGEVRTLSRVASSSWRKWRPDHPTSPHWYTSEQFTDLLAAYVAADRAAGRGRTVREVVAEFGGLSGTGKQKQVTGGVGLTGAALEDLVVGDGLDRARVEKLLATMRRASRPVKPPMLGVLGAGHLTDHLVAHWEVTKESVRYAKRAGVRKGLPFAVETAFGVRNRGSRVILAGLNFSPLLNPDTFRYVSSMVGVRRMDPWDPVVLVVHVACPHLRFSDHGKSAIDLLEEE